MHKRLIAALLASLALIATACQTDADAGDTQNGEQQQEQQQDNGY